MCAFKTVRGMRDFLPEEANLMEYIQSKAGEVAKIYGYERFITPVVEPYELLSAKAGEEMKSRMFTFKDLGDRTVALRPEFTASVARLVATTLRTEPKPLRIFCTGSVYRYDEPQKGRYREFWQSNYELVGSSNPEADAEILLLTNRLMEKVGLKGHSLRVGHIGVLRGLFNEEKLSDKVQNAVMQLMDKKQYDDALRKVEEAGGSERIHKRLQKLIELTGNKPFDIIESIKQIVGECKEALEAAQNLLEILELVSDSGSKTEMIVDAGFARGLEYYTGMIFEPYIPELDIALGGGGRYDRLVELFGGEPTPCVGVAHGLDRIMLGMQLQGTVPDTESRKKVLVTAITAELSGDCVKIAERLREADVSVEVEVMGRKMARILEDADRRGIGFAVIVGERELKEGAVVVKDLTRREQRTVSIEKILGALKNQA